jgi:tRNA guanosine-2'-O-methyltransferase
MLWDRTMAMFNLPATNLMRVEVYGLTAKFFDYYFEIDDTTGQPLMDLRMDEGFWKLIQAGLRSKDSIARKYSVYILKRVTDISSKITHNDTIEWTRYFQWDDANAQEYQYLFEDLFLLYDTMHESVGHLVDPILPRLETLMTGSGLALDPSWWTLLLYRGFQNEAISVRKKILEYVLNLDKPAPLLVVAKRPEFLFGVFFAAIDTSSLYTVQTLGTMISPFGEMLRKFIRNLIQCLDDPKEKAELIRQLIHHIAFVMTSFIPIIYIAEALTDVDSCEAFGSVELKSIRVLVDRNRSFQKQNAKIWIRRLCIRAVAQLSNTADLSFSDRAKTINSLIDGYPIGADTLEYKYLAKLIKDYESEKDAKADVQLAERVVAFLKEPFSEDDILDSVQKQAYVISRASLFMPNLDNQFAALIHKLQEMQSDETASAGYLNKIVILLTTVWNEYTKLKNGEDTEFASRIGLDSSLSVQIIQWLNNLYLTSGEPAPIVHSFGPLYVSLTKHILMSDNLTDISFRTDTVSKYIQDSFDGIKGSSENSLEQETLKMNHLLVTEMSFTLATDMELKGVVSDPKTLVGIVSGSRLKRTPDFSSSGKTWGSLVADFISRKWNCLSAIIRYLRMVCLISLLSEAR